MWSSPTTIGERRRAAAPLQAPLCRDAPAHPRARRARGWFAEPGGYGEGMAEDQKPSEQRGGTTPDDAEAREKGPWAGQASEGVVPAELGGSDAPRELLDEDPQLKSSVLGKTTGSDEPATDGGIDLSAGDEADATTDGGDAAG